LIVGQDRHEEFLSFKGTPSSGSDSTPPKSSRKTR